jgi:hypothetical protein
MHHQEQTVGGGIWVLHKLLTNLKMKENKLKLLFHLITVPFHQGYEGIEHDCCQISTYLT